MRFCLCLLTVFLPFPSIAQWILQDSQTKQDLYAVSSPSEQVAWASGGNGVVVRTVDGGRTWQPCAVPAGGAKRNFSSIQALDGTTAVLMSSGNGEQSALYRTTDGCLTWKLVFANPEGPSSFDSLRRVTSKQIYLLAEPVGGKFAMYLSQDAGATWFIADDPGLEAEADESASKSTLWSQGPFLLYVTTGATKGYVHFTYAKCEAGAPDGACALAWGRAELPVAGVSSVASRMETGSSGALRMIEVAVGASVALSSDGGKHWTVPAAPLLEHQNAVVYASAVQRWISVGPAGTQISRNDGRSWSPVKKTVGGEAAYDKDWTALSLPFVVGKEGKVGVLHSSALD